MSLLSKLKQAFPGFKFKQDFSLASQAYSKIGGQAEMYIKLKKREEIVELVSFCKKNNIKLTILGSASNVIISDEGISGLVLQLANNSIEDLNKKNKNGEYLIRVGAGFKTSLFVQKTVDLGFTGLEHFMGVPGTLGGAIYNNAHYLEELISKHIHRIEVIDKNGLIKWLNPNECGFDYDKSRFHSTQEIILSAEFALKKGSKEESQKLIGVATKYRALTQPLGDPSSGCIFKNTPNNPTLKKLFPQFKDKKFVSGGFLIDKAGLKGVKIGEVEVSTKHAAFFVNKGKGTAEDLKKLIALVKQTVEQKFGVKLEEEVFHLS
jgi:UDP-N-acetylmuramate dehydrogenase